MREGEQTVIWPGLMTRKSKKESKERVTRSRRSGDSVRSRRRPLLSRQKGQKAELKRSPTGDERQRPEDKGTGSECVAAGAEDRPAEPVFNGGGAYKEGPGAGGQG